MGLINLMLSFTPWCLLAVFAQQQGTGSCIPQPFVLHQCGATMLAGSWTAWIVCSSVPRNSCRPSTTLALTYGMDVAWGHVTSQYGLHRPSITGPIFAYRVCTTLGMTTPSRAQILTHANLRRSVFGSS